jgi:DNA repair protein RecN (Recombination protein N)
MYARQRHSASDVYMAFAFFRNQVMINVRRAVVSVYMLRELEIREFALIEHLRLPFSDGLNVLTGETGAGKSIIIDALNVVLGGKAGATTVRTGAERAVVEATFAASAEVVAWLKQNELLEDDGAELVVSREINKSGTKARINGTLVNLALLQELRQKLLTIHAQHEARTLQSAQAQLDMLDALGDEGHKHLVSQVRTLYAKRKELSAQIADITLSEEERSRRLDFARFQLTELLDAALTTADEDEAVATQIKVLANVVELESALATAQQYLSEGDGDAVPAAIDLVQRAAVELSAAAEMDPSLSSIAESLNACADTLEQESRALRKYRDKLDTDPETLGNLEARLAQLATVKRKYGPGISDAIARQQALTEEIDKLENAQVTFDELKAEQEQVSDQLNAAAIMLSAKRKKLGEHLAERIKTQLNDLGMPHCKFVISLDKSTADGEDKPAVECGPSGIDRAEFLIAPNPGQPLAPVAKIASGGELSRVMLAVKSIFAHADSVATVIFDEIEAGLSGRTLQAMRDKLAQLARSHQILCITHQPLIASVADNHIEVSKHQTTDATTISASVLVEKQRLKSVAGMASGQDDQAEALKFAEALFADSAKLRTTLK